MINYIAQRILQVAAVTLVLNVFSAYAQSPTVKVGLALDLSGPLAGPGNESKDGFDLAIGQLNGKLGGLPVEFIQADTAGNPEQAKQIVERMIQRDHIDLFTGPMGSNVALAIGPSLFAAKVPYLSNAAGPSQYAGAQCNPYFVSTAYQNDSYTESAAKYAQDKGVKNVVIVAPNYTAGRDAVTGFRRMYSGAAQEIYTKLGQLDYAVELAQIRAAKPEAVYFFLPGAMGINFVKQYTGAGLQKQTTLISTGFSADQDVIAAVGEPMLNLVNTSHWAHDLQNPANQRFVEAFRKKFGRVPTQFAAQAYDVILAMDAAVKAAGTAANRDGVLSAVRGANFDSVRGQFAYNTNNFPIQRFYIRRVVKDPQLGLTNKLQGVVIDKHVDAYVSQCQMKR